MNWTTEKPKSPGYYWYRRDEFDRSIICEITDDGYASFIASDYDKPLAEMTGLFAGPIPPPGVSEEAWK